MRYRIYQFAFNNAEFGVCKQKDSQGLESYTVEFPIALNATCHLLRAEVEQYLAHYLWVGLGMESTTMYDYAQLVIPQRYLARVHDVVIFYNNKSAAEHAALIHTGLRQLSGLHKVEVVFLSINSCFVECSNWELAILGVGPKRRKDQMVADDALGILDDIEHMRHEINRWCEMGVKVKIKIKLGYGKNNIVSSYCWVMVVNVPGSREIVWAIEKILAIKHADTTDMEHWEKSKAFEPLINRPGDYVSIFNRRRPPIASGVSLT